MPPRPRAAKRKATNPSRSLPPSKLAHLDSVTSASSKAASKTNDTVDNFFRTHANSSSNMLEPEGIEKLCSDLKLDANDVKVLMLAWKMKAGKQGYFTQDEWQRGLKALKVDTITELKKSLPGLEEEVLKPENFEDFYSYAFRYNLIDDKKGLDIDTACTLLDIVLGSHQFNSEVDLFQDFLQEQKQYKVINLDQWVNFYKFCNEINFSKLDDYDDTEAWPVLLDNFVYWMKGTPPNHS